MSPASKLYPKEGIITFLAYLVLLPLGALFFLMLFGWLVGVAFGQSFSDFLRTLPGSFEVALEVFNIYITVSIILFAMYFGLRTATGHWFGWLGAVLAALVMPFIAMTLIGLFNSSWQTVMDDIINELTVDGDDTIVILLPTLASILLIRYLLIKAGVLCRQEATS